ncbi:uncharacterized protein LOC134244056 isoform X1 [Saccostrea cucullata]|uniref:uncharacterized protein LOC134244056 isoform X1 n=1 Tax=Saccostrea cuccullata TaxID=36930 RepID=UPI002ED44C66
MAGWHSLSGYLYFRTGGGISLLKTRKRMWCVLEERQSQLVYYKNEEDVRTGKSPQGSLSLIGAAISLDLDNNNQFIILSNNKEHMFTAENHESMMIWLLGLQARRDLTGGNGADGLEECFPKVRHNVCDGSDGSGTSALNKTAASLSRRKQHWHSTARATESLDSGATHYRSKGEPDSLERSRSLPPVFEAVECPSLATNHTTRSHMSKSFEGRLSKDSGLGMSCQSWKFSTLSLDNQHKALRELCREESISSDDEVFKELTEVNGFPESVNNSNIINSRVEEEGLKSETREQREYVNGEQREYVNGEQNESKEVGSCSSLSYVSSDSAIDRGEASSSELASRLIDLEKELISTKCELAQVMNRQAGLQELLAQRDEAIRFLEGRLDTSNTLDKSLTGKTSKQPPVKSEKELQERLRILQNQNRFLNEEVKKLAKLRQTDRSTFYQQEDKVRALEAEIEKWHLDYVSLIQSSIRFSGCDTMDDAELVLFGGDRHKRKIQKLLEEARSVNPSLPTYESLASGEVHVDSYGFKHVFEDTSNGLLLHYLCQELTLHYLMQAGSYEEHQKKWTHFMRLHGKSMASHLKDMKSLCRGGIPDRFRTQVWRQLVYWQVREVMSAKGQHYYRNLCNMLPDSPLAARYRKQISLDLMRTMPSNMKFSSQGCKGVMDLQDVLLAYCVHNPTIGYCQGMNFIVGLALIFMEAQDAFWTVVAVTEKYFPCHYFDQNLIGAQSDQQVLKDLLAEKLPKLSRHLESIDIEISTVTLNWFLAIFFDAVPFQTLLRIWDCFLLEGPKVLFRFALAILKLHEKEILQKTDTISIMRHLKAAAKLTFDADGLIKVAFDGLKPFPRRKDISTKQACYLNTLKEQNKRKELQRLAYAEREHMYMSMESESGNYQNLGAAVVVEDGKVWLTYGEQNSARICKVTCEEGVMYDLGMNFDSRVMCMENASDSVVLMGTLSWMLYAYDSKTRERLWELLLHDAVLSLCCFEDDDSMLVRTFAGLADGTLAVTEQQDIRKVFPSNDVLYIPIGQAPISCLLLLDDFLWCASGNSVNVIQARTLDPIDNFHVSVNPYDHILSMVPGDYGIWVTLRGSSILELWDPKNLNCKLLYDTRTDRYPQLRKEDDTYFNRARITAIMDLGTTVWVGTGEGNLIIYEILEHLNLKTPTDASPTTETSQKMISSGTATPISKAKSVIKSKSSPVLCSKQIRKRSPKPKLLKEEHQPVLPVKSDLLSKILNSSEAESTGSLTPKNSSPRHPPLCGKKLTDQKVLMNGWKETEVNCVDFQMKDTLTGRTESESDGSSSTYHSDREEELGEPLHDVHQSKVPCTMDVRERRESVDFSPKQTKAVRPTNLLPTKQWSSRHKDIASQENLDCLFKQLIDVKRRSSLDIAMKNHVKKTKSCECLTFDNSYCNGLDTKSVDSDQKEDCGFLIDCSVSKTGQSPITGEDYQKEALQETISCDTKVMSRHHKVNSWLSSLHDSQCDSDNEEMKEGEFHSNIEENLCSGSKSTTEGSPDQLKTSEEALCNGVDSVLETQKSENTSNTSTSISHSDVDKERRSSCVSEIMSKVLRPRKSEDRTLDTSSESDRPTQMSKSNAEEAKYYLEFSEMQVLTDVEGELSRRSSQVRRRSSELSSDMETRLITQMSKLENWSLNNSKSSVSSSPRILELMQTPSLASRHQSVGRVSRELVPGDLSTSSPRSSMDQRVADFLRTPSISSRPSSVWSSYENISTPSVKEQDFIGQQFANISSYLTHTDSSNSLSSLAEALCVVELSMEVKVKIADKPVRGFLKTRNCGEPSILSFTGCYGDDESVLKWRREPNEKFWTNEPVLEICPKTKLTRLPSYMRGRLSSVSSQASTKSFHSVSSQLK